MTTDQRITELAREIAARKADQQGLPSTHDRILSGEIDDCERVQVEISTIRAGMKLGQEIERERCAVIADILHYPDETKISSSIRDAIRAQKETEQ